MTENVQTIKVFVNHDNKITFTCPKCTKPASLKVDSLKSKISPLKIRCTCKNIFNLDIDYRVYYRKRTDIPGRYRSIQPYRSNEEDMHILNISREGIGFKIFTGQKIKVGNKLEVRFNLDDKKKTPIQKRVEVINIDGDYVGCRFCDINVFEQALGYYLQR